MIFFILLKFYIFTYILVISQALYLLHKKITHRSGQMPSVVGMATGRGGYGYHDPIPIPIIKIHPHPHPQTQRVYNF